MRPAISVTKIAIARAGPVDRIISKLPNAIAPRPTMTVAALALITAPIRRTVVFEASCQSPPPRTSSRYREIRKIA